MRTFKTNLFLLGLCAILGFGVVACDGDNEKENDPKPTPGQTENPGGTNNGGNNDQTPGTPGAEAPVFPEVTTLAGKAGDTLTLSFGANLNWELTTNTLWCQLNNGLFNLSGEKGEQEIKVAITDANQGFEIDSANITLKMGEESQVIAKVFRAALNYEVQVKPFGGEEDAEYNNENPIVIDSYASIDIEVNTNFVWGVSTTAEWIDVTKSENIVTLTVKDGYTQNAINNSNDVICINTETATIVTIPVSYLGMDPMAITINPSTKWNMQISADGKSYSESSMSDGAVATNAAPYTAKLTALNNEYTLVSYKYNEWGLAIFQPEMGDTPWFTVEDDKAGNISVSFNENTTKKERQGYLFALPNAKYNEIKDNLDGFFIEDMNADVWEVSVAAERYTVAHFVQMIPATEGSEGGVTAKYTTGNMEKIPVQMLSADNNPEIYEFICSEYGVTSVAYAIVEPKTPFQIFPSFDGWEGELSAFVMGNNKDFVSEWGFEPGMDSNEKMYCQCYGIGNEAIGTYAFIAFKKNGINQQILVVDLTEYVAPEKDLEILDVMAGSAIPSAKADSESEIYMYISSEYSVESVFTTNLDPKANIFVNPTTEFDNVKVFVNGTDNSTEWSVEAMELMGNMGVLLSVPADAANTTAHVVFYSNQIAKEVLYINVKGAERATEVEIFPSNVWNITISQDGSTYKNMFDTPYTATVTAVNNDYVLVEYTYKSNFGLTQVQETTPAWFNTENDGQGNIIVTFPANSGEERKGYLFAVPGAKYEEIKNNLDGFFVEDMNAAIWEVSVAAEQYVVGEFIQEGIAAEPKGLTITAGIKSIDVTTLTEMHEDLYYYLTGEFGAEKAYMAMASNPYMTITPGVEFDEVVIYEKGSTENIASGDICELTMDYEDNMALMFYPSEELMGKEFIILFKSNYVTKAGLYFIYAD